MNDNTNENNKNKNNNHIAAIMTTITSSTNNIFRSTAMYLQLISLVLIKHPNTNTVSTYNSTTSTCTVFASTIPTTTNTTTYYYHQYILLTIV